MLFFHTFNRPALNQPRTDLPAARVLTNWCFYQYDGDSRRYRFELGFQPQQLRRVLTTQQWNTEPGIIAADIEHHLFTNQEETDAAVDELLDIFFELRALAPYKRLGLYNFLPRRNVWDPIRWNSVAFNPTHPRYQEYLNRYTTWQQATVKFKTHRGNHKGLADVLDFMAPSLYSFYYDPNFNGNRSDDPKAREWEIWARDHVRLAQFFDKPVYVFIAREWHPGGTVRNDGGWGKPLEPDYVLWQLEHLRTWGADGVILWSDLPFRDDDPWWQAVREFAKTAA